MAEVTLSAGGKKIQIVDNGDFRLGDGDSVRIDDSKARPINDPKLAEDLKTAGVELANLRGGRVHSLSGFLRSLDAIRTDGAGENDLYIEQAKMMAKRAGIASNPAVIREIYRAAYERESEDLRESLSLYAFLPAKYLSTKLEKTRLQYFLTRVANIQRYANRAGIEFPSEKPDIKLVHRYCAEVCMQNAERSPSWYLAKSSLDKAREHAREAGIAFDEQRVADIKEFRRKEECGSPRQYGYSRISLPPGFYAVPSPEDISATEALCNEGNE